MLFQEAAVHNLDWSRKKIDVKMMMMMMIMQLTKLLISRSRSGADRAVDWKDKSRIKSEKRFEILKVKVLRPMLPSRRNILNGDEWSQQQTENSTMLEEFTIEDNRNVENSNKLPGCHLANAWRSHSTILQWRYRNEVSVHSFNSFIHSFKQKPWSLLTFESRSISWCTAVREQCCKPVDWN